MSLFNARRITMHSKILNKIKNLKQFFANDAFQRKYKQFIKTQQLKSADKIFTHLTHQEKMKLYELAETKQGIFVEIGSYVGASSCFIAASLKNKNNSRLYCIDTWENDAMSEGKQQTYDIFINNINLHEKYIIPQKGTSLDISRNFNDKIDFLFIDGDHSYQGVKIDVENWFPKLNKNALVILHDIGWAEGVQKVAKELVQPYVTEQGQLPNLWWGIFK